MTVLICATAVYAGLRRGELQALRRRDVDLRRGVMHVRRSWGTYEGEVDPRSRAGVRYVPIPHALRQHLEPLPGDGDDDLVFGRTAALPFNPRTLSARAQRCWRF